MKYEALLGLIGFFIGVVLHIFLLSIVWKRRKTKKDRLGRAFLFLLFGLLLWYSGNFVSLLLRQMNVLKVSVWLEAVDAIAFTGLSLLPALLLHTHWIYSHRSFRPGRVEAGIVTTVLFFLYGQLLLLPFALARLFEGPVAAPLQKLGPFTLPFLLTLALSYYASCLLQFRILQRSKNAVEKEVFAKLIFFFLLIPLFNFWVFQFGGARTTHGELWVNLALLASILPTFVVAYYIYRHQFLQITVRRSLASALLILLIILAYLAGIRGFGQYLEEELEAPPLLLEGTFLVTLLLFFPPLSRWWQNRVSRIFTGEIDIYRRLANTLGQSAPFFVSPETLKEFLEKKLSRELANVEVRLHLDNEARPHRDESLYPLRSGDRQLGYLEARLADEVDSPGHREGLRLLASEVAILLERARFLETQLQLKRELAEKTHLEDLGRMAATIAHNVKNPLSSIKTLLQLQCEAENLTPEQRDEMSMMTGEIDRLAKTVSALLRFSKLDRPEAASPAKELINPYQLLRSLEDVFQGDIKSKEIVFRLRVRPESLRLKSDADMLNDILGNLISNALEASPRGGTIDVGVERTRQKVNLEVQDEGPGIPLGVRAKVLEPFFTTKARGTGLGLAIVKRRVDQLGGRLTIEDPKGKKGTRVIVTLETET